jgi:hypothetical protein
MMLADLPHLVLVDGEHEPIANLRSLLAAPGAHNDMTPRTRGVPAPATVEAAPGGGLGVAGDDEERRRESAGSFEAEAASERDRRRHC